MGGRRPCSAVLAFGMSAIVAGCAYPRTPRLETPYDLTKGYRFELQRRQAQAPNPDELFVVLAFSGGGTRAAALSYGVLKQLADVSLPGGRTLLDEVDVMSSVSGGSFTSAFYALRGREIFDPASAFHRKLLYYQLQSDLVRNAVYRPQNWKHLGSRVEIAARNYEQIFGHATFADLTTHPERPYLILNGTDASTGARFEFTQEQFDLLCADLARFPLARAVAASSAFPGLLNSMTVDNHNRDAGCGYNGPGARADDWVADAANDRAISYRRFAAGRDVRRYLDAGRRHLHVLDGGLADNIGLRSILQSLNSADRPIIERQGADPLQGGWSLLQKINNQEVKTIVVITVNAKTDRRKRWDEKRSGPGTFSVLSASAGIPMGNFTMETLELMRGYAKDAELTANGPIRIHGVEIAFDDLPDPDEQVFFGNLGTNFGLDRFEVDCLIDRGGRLLREARSVTDNPAPGQPAQSFREFVATHLGGTIAPPPRGPERCTDAAGAQAIRTRPHNVDLGLQYSWTRAQTTDLRDREGAAVAVRVTKPNGLGMTAGIGRTTFAVDGTGITAGEGLGDLGFVTFSVGGFLARRVGPLELSGGADLGYGVGTFTLTDRARDRYGRAGLFDLDADADNAWIVTPRLSAWWTLNDRWAATISASYPMTSTKVRFGGDVPSAARDVSVRALKVGVGFGVKVF